MRLQVESTPLQVLTQNLLDEKNNEIDSLTQQIKELKEAGDRQDEIDNIVSMTVKHSENEGLFIEPCPSSIVDVV